MLDFNLLSKDVRAKKQKEIERIKSYAPKHSDSTRGQKISEKKASINFFSRFFKKSQPKAPVVAASPAASAQSILQTPKETPPPPPPQVPVSPLKPVVAPEVMKAPQPVKKTAPTPAQAELKLQPAQIKRASDGIILPDISSIIQKNIEKPISQIPATSTGKAAPPIRRKPSVPPPPPIKKIEVMPSFGKRADSVPAPKPKPKVSVMPQKTIAKPAPSVWVMAAAGILSLGFAASFVAGSFFVLNRWVLALEKVKETYEERSRSVEKIIQNVGQYARESDDLAQKTQILYEILKAESKNEN